HRRERKLLTPPFHGDRMRAYGTVMVEAARRAFADLDVGREFVALDRTTEISLEAIVRAVFGVEEHERVREFQRTIVALLDAAKPVFLFSKATQRAPFGLGPWATYLNISAAADRMLHEQIDRTRPQAAVREDILSMMLAARYEDGAAMTDAHI